MAMTKAEKAAVEALKTEVSFRWPTEAEPKPQGIPERGEIVGWDFNVYAGLITEKWSTRHSHGTVYEGRRTGSSQQGARLYATRREAWVALRWAMCRDVARKLRQIDIRIEDEAAA